MSSPQQSPTFALKQKPFKREYGLAELGSAVIYLGLGIAFFVISGQTFGAEGEVKLSPRAQSFVSDLGEYNTEILPRIEQSWRATSPNLTTFFTIHADKISISKHADVAKSTYLAETEYNAPTPTTNTGSNDFFHVEITTDRNTFTTTIVLNRSIVERKVICNAVLNNCANQTAACISTHGPMARYAFRGDGNDILCNVPMMSNENCIILAERWSDAGVKVWSKDHEMTGCEYPFEKQWVRRESDDIEFTIRSRDDPYIRQQVLSKGGALKLKVDKKDNVPTAVGILLCALILFVGACVMLHTLIDHFWSEYQTTGRIPFVDDDSRGGGEEEEDQELTDIRRVQQQSPASGVVDRTHGVLAAPHTSASIEEERNELRRNQRQQKRRRRSSAAHTAAAEAPEEVPSPHNETTVEDHWPQAC